jgi:chitinase
MLTLDGKGSQAGAGGTLAYRWRQVSGPAAGLTDADKASAVVVPFAAGYLEFELTVAEGAVVGVPARVGVEVPAAGAALPVAVATAPGTAVVGELVFLDGSQSTGAARYRWTQVAGPWVALQAATASPSFVAAAAGQYVFELEVDDGVVRSRPRQVSVLVTGEGN